MRISLKVDVEDTAGFKEGLPALLKLLDQYHIQASFFFSLGYDNSGLRIKNLFNPSVLTRQLPFSQKLYGTLLPPKLLSKKYQSLIKSCAEAGHDVGIKSFDSLSWVFNAIDANQEWTQRMLLWSIESFDQLLGFKPKMHSASGFMVNEHLFRLQQQHDFKIGLDTRGKTAFLPQYRNTQSSVVQLPVTLSAVEELLIKPEINLDNVHEYLFVESQKQLPHGHVYEVRAAFEGRQWLPVLEKLIVMWRGSQWQFNRLSETAQQLPVDQLQVHQVGWSQYPPHHRYMATQGIPL